MNTHVSELAASYLGALRIFYNLAINSRNRKSGRATTPDEAAYAAIHGMTNIAQSRQREAATRGDINAAENADAEVAFWALMKAEMDKQSSEAASGSSKAARLFQVLGDLCKADEPETR